MRKLTSIVAVNQAGVIGCRNSLPWRVKSDLAFFRATTSENVVVMGRKTFDSLGKCLPKRYNIVLSRGFGLFEDTKMCVRRAGIAEGLAQVEDSPVAFKEAFVIGGATMYEQFAHLVDRYLITVIDKVVSEGDAFFDVSVLNNQEEWSLRRVTARAKGDGDEAAYEIFELQAKDADRRAELRRQLVASFRGEQRVGGQKLTRRMAMGSDARSLAFDW